MNRKHVQLVLILAVCTVIVLVLAYNLSPVPELSAGTDAALSAQKPAELPETKETAAPEPLSLTQIRANSFPDVEQTASYYDPVCYVACTGLMNGTSALSFEPTAFATRGDLAYALYQMSGSADEAAAAFSDFSSEQRAIAWTDSEGIMYKITDSSFQPDCELTREEAAAALYAFAKYVGYPVTYTTCIETESDASQVDSSAYEAVDWALASGVFKPLVTTKILPQASVTRAQLAKMLVSFLAYTTQEEVAAGIADKLRPALSQSAGQGAENESVSAEIVRISENYGAVGAQIAVIHNGIVADTYSYGSATKGVQEMTADTKLRIASISKVVLGMVAMSMQEDGVIDIDTDIGEYWGASIRNPWHKDTPVTIRSILSHTSSITVYGDGVSTSGSSIRSKLTSSSCFSRLVPGSIYSWGYNNYAFDVLGVTLEVAADETINSIADRKFFDYLDIDASYGSGNVDTDQLATLYNHDGSVARTVDYQKAITGSTYPGQSGSNFAGGLTISSYDLAKLVSVLANDGVYDDQRLLSGDLVTLMETVSEEKVQDNSFYQGLPLRYQTGIYGQDSLYYHTGSAYGVYNCVSYNPETKNGVVVLTTGASGAKDTYGIYKICGEISEYIYSNSFLS